MAAERRRAYSFRSKSSTVSGMISTGQRRVSEVSLVCGRPTHRGTDQSVDNSHASFPQQHPMSADSNQCGSSHVPMDHAESSSSGTNEHEDVEAAKNMNQLTSATAQVIINTVNGTAQSLPGRRGHAQQSARVITARGQTDTKEGQMTLQVSFQY